MESSDPTAVNDQQLKSIGEQKRIAQLEHQISSVLKQMDEKGTKLKEAQEQIVALKDRIGTLEQEKLETSLLTETLTKSRDRVIQEKTALRNELLDVEKRKDELELQVSKLNSDKRHYLEDNTELRQKCDHLWSERSELQSQVDDFQSDKALIVYDKEQWKREKEILLASKQWYMTEIADREQKINELIQTKSDAARHLLECQNECHALRLAADRTRHEADVQVCLNVDQLEQRLQQCAQMHDEAEARAAQYARERDQLRQHAEQQQMQHQRAAEAWERETQRQLAEERAKIMDELNAQNEAELARVQTEATNTQQRLTEILKKAAGKNGKLKEERNQLFAKQKFLEDNLDAYKRRFVAELQRLMDTRHSQMGNELLNAFVDVVGRMDDKRKGFGDRDSIAPFVSELERVQTEATNTQQRLTEILKKAAEKNGKLEEECNQLFEKHKLLEGNLDTHKRRFVAELQRSIDTRCTQMGNGLRNAQQKLEMVDKENRGPPSAASTFDAAATLSSLSRGEKGMMPRQTQQRHGPSMANMNFDAPLPQPSSVAARLVQQRKHPPTSVNSVPSPSALSSTSHLFPGSFLPPPLPQQQSPAGSAAKNKRGSLRAVPSAEWHR